MRQNSSGITASGHEMRLYGLTLIIALLLAGLSLGGLLAPGSFYPTIELRQSFLSNDAVNLFIGLPILLGSLVFTWCGKLIGLLFQASMLFVGLLAFFILNSFSSAVSFPWGDFLVVFLMGFLCFIPFGLFIRGMFNGSRMI